MSQYSSKESHPYISEEPKPNYEDLVKLKSHSPLHMSQIFIA